MNTLDLWKIAIEGRMTDSPNLYLRYLGALGLLAECAVYVPEDQRESIEQAMRDACAHHPLQWRRVIDSVIIEPREEAA